jgi:ankyrin repeat protein
MKNIYDINITEESDEIYDKNNDQNSFKIYSDLILPCNINYNLSKYIFRNIEFKGVFRNKFFEEQRTNKYDLIKKKASRISVLSFPSLKKNGLLVSKLERFLVDKTNLIKEDEDSNWKKEKYNFMMIHKFKIKNLSWAKNENSLINKNNNIQKFEVYQRNDYKSNVRNTLHVSKRKIIGIQRISVTSSINTKNINRSLLKKKTISLFKRPSLDPRIAIKTKKRKNFNKISILVNKTFFNRKNETNINYARKKSSIFVFEDDQNEDNINNNENKDINSKNIIEHPKNIDDVYFGLTLLIAKGKEYQFRKFFNKYEKIIDIDFPIYEGNTLLMMSTKEGMAGITRFLCEKKADVNLKNDRGNTALHYAIGQKFFKIVDILTIFGAREDILNNKGQSPWDC